MALHLHCEHGLLHRATLPCHSTTCLDRGRGVTKEQCGTGTDTHVTLSDQEQLSRGQSHLPMMLFPGLSCHQFNNQMLYSLKLALLPSLTRKMYSFAVHHFDSMVPCITLTPRHLHGPVNTPGENHRESHLALQPAPSPALQLPHMLGRALKPISQVGQAQDKHAPAPGTDGMILMGSPR